jgi:hypothetical protein
MHTTSTTIPIRDFLHQLFSRQAPAEGLDWLQDRLNEYQKTGLDRTFYLTFSAVPRYLGRAPLELDAADLGRAELLRPGFDPGRWTVDRAARVWLALHLPAEDADEFVRPIELLFDHADLGEAVALYGGLPLLPHPERFVARAAEGVRSNMTAVFNAVALDNPYPADYLPEGAWNQLVLKAAFLDQPLHRIHGLDARANPTLARIISDYAHERWAAGRAVSPELWRPAGRFIDDRLLDDLRRLFASDNPLERKAAALACAAADRPAAAALLAQHPELETQVKTGEIDWEAVADKLWKEKVK